MCRICSLTVHFTLSYILQKYFTSLLFWCHKLHLFIFTKYTLSYEQIPVQKKPVYTKYS